MTVFYTSCPECGTEYVDHKSGESAYFVHDELGEDDSNEVFITPESCFPHIKPQDSDAPIPRLDQ